MSGNLVLVGAQWGDEGKGKIVDYITQEFDIVARYQGGNNAGHTVIIGGKKYVCNLVPSGIFNEECLCILGNGMVVDPIALMQEISLLPPGCALRVRVSDRVHLTLPWHKEVENVRSQVGHKGIGTTGRGIGPTYESKMARSGIRASDCLDTAVLRGLVETSLANCYELSGCSSSRIKTMLEEFMKAASLLAPLVADTSFLIRAAIKNGKRILIEGAQGAMLDIDHGTYPYVTSSNTTSGGACTGLGIPPKAINTVIGVAKAYTTRVGNGPFPTELFGKLSERIVRVGQEFGATTGRRRRPGWIDLVQLRYAVEINGIDALVLTKADVLSGLSSVGLCSEYIRKDGSLLPSFPANLETLEQCRPFIEYVSGWGDISRITSYAKLPSEFRRFVTLIELNLGIPVIAVSTGPERHQTIVRGDVLTQDLLWMANLHKAAVLA